MLKQLRPAIVSFLLLTLMTGAVYPALVTVIGKSLFSHQAEGSLVLKDGKPIGSELIAQSFTDPRYFWPRPSACNYDGAAASGSNQALSNPARQEVVAQRIAALREADPGNEAAVPVDLLSASGSGLDPHISPDAARYQLGRVARSRNLAEAEVQKLVEQHTEPPTLGVLGEPRVNVLALNLALDAR